MRTFTETLTFESERAPQFIDITDEVTDVVDRSEVETGYVAIFSRHTTAAIKINEAEPLLLKDMEHFLERLASKDAYYGHNDFAIRTVHMHEDECPNGHSHCQHLFLGASENIPVVDGRLTLGEFQRIFMVELDDQKDQRTILVQVMGI